MSGFRADFCCIRMFKRRPPAPLPSLVSSAERGAAHQHSETGCGLDAEASCASDGRQTGLDGGVKQEGDRSSVRSTNAVECGERAQAFYPVGPLLTRPEHDREAGPRHQSSRVLPEQRHRPSITVNNSFLVVFFISLFLPQTGRRAHTRPSSRSSWE